MKESHRSQLFLRPTSIVTNMCLAAHRPHGGGLERSSHGPSSCCWNEGIQVLVNTVAVTAGNSDPSPSCI